MAAVGRLHSEELEIASVAHLGADVDEWTDHFGDAALAVASVNECTFAGSGQAWRNCCRHNRGEAEGHQHRWQCRSQCHPASTHPRCFLARVSEAQYRNRQECCGYPECRDTNPMIVCSKCSGEDEDHAGGDDGLEPPHRPKREGVGQGRTDGNCGSGSDRVVPHTGHRRDGRWEEFDDQSEIDGHHVERAR